MPARRIEAGPLLALLGALVLLVALFVDWYEPALSAWDVFELVDLVLAALAVAAVLAAGAQLGLLTAPDPRWLPWCCGAAFVIVAATAIDAPPGASAADRLFGLWLALAAALVMALGAVLTNSRVKISFDVEGRRRRVSPVTSRDDEAGADDRAARRAERATGGREPDDAPSALPTRRVGRAEGPPETDDADERPTYRMPFDPPEDEVADEPLRPDEPWADPEPRRGPDPS